MIVCETFQKRLDDAWHMLQGIVQNRHEKISQFELDHECVKEIERIVNQLELKQEREEE